MNEEISDQDKFLFYKKFGKAIAESLLLHSDKVGFYKTKNGMKTSQGIGEMIYDEFENLCHDEFKKP